MQIIDITRELFSTPVYPGDTVPAYTRVRKMPDDAYNLTDVSLCVHNATHADAPRHFIQDGAAIDELPLDIFYGECVVVEFSGDITPFRLAPYLECERVLIKGGTSLTREACEVVARSRRLRLVGVESQSVGTPDAPAVSHVILLSAGIIPLEGLDLSDVTPGKYTLSALPLKLAGCDGAPVRAVLICED